MPPKIGRGAVVEHLRFEGFVREVTSTGRLGPGSPCSASRTAGNPRQLMDGPAIGVDIGAGMMAMCSDGTESHQSKGAGQRNDGVGPSGPGHRPHPEHTRQKPPSPTGGRGFTTDAGHSMPG